MTITRLTKRGAGKMTGQDWPNSAEFATLGRHLSKATEDSTFFIGFDRDREDPIFFGGSPVVLSASGTPEKPIRLEAGYIGHAMDVQPARSPAPHIFFKNPMASIKKGPAPDRGGRLLTLQNGTSHVRLIGFRVEGAPFDGFMKFAGGQGANSFKDIVIEGISATQSGRIIECDANAAIDGLVMENCDAFQLVRGFARFRSLSNATLRNMFLDAASADGGGTNVCQLIQIASGKAVTFDNVVLRNAANTIGANARDRNAYVQGDGIVTEAGTVDFAFHHCHASGMGDAGFDLKTVGVTLEDCSAYGCKFGVRIWSQAKNTLRRCTIGNPRSTSGNRGACVQVDGTADVIDCVLTATPGSAVFAFNGGRETTNRSIRVFGGSIRLDSSAALMAGTGYGRLELHDVAINGSIRNGQYDYRGKDLL